MVNYFTIFDQIFYKLKNFKGLIGAVNKITNGLFSYHLDVVLFELVQEGYVRDIEQVSRFSYA